jgi:L-iditol 2-dehydrogenase
MGHFGQERRHVVLSLELIKEGKISADKLITHILPLEKIHEGLALLKDKKALKVLIKP